MDLTFIIREKLFSVNFAIIEALFFTIVETTEGIKFRGFTKL